jgi:4-hydroxy-tetrahydrodipicolinate reductase
MALRICIGGATGWTGSALVAGVLAADDLELSGAVAPKSAGRDIGEVLGKPAHGVNIAASVALALKAKPTDVYIDYTHPSAVKANVLTARRRSLAPPASAPTTMPRSPPGRRSRGWAWWRAAISR